MVLGLERLRELLNVAWVGEDPSALSSPLGIFTWGAEGESLEGPAAVPNTPAVGPPGGTFPSCLLPLCLCSGDSRQSCGARQGIQLWKESFWKDPRAPGSL